MDFGSQVSTKVIIEFLKKAIMEEGLPKELVSDNGPQFVSRELSQFLAERGVKHRRTAVYNPQCNGLVERFNRVLGGFIRTAVMCSRQNIKESIDQQVFNYRNTPHPLTVVDDHRFSRAERVKSSLGRIRDRVSKSQAKMITDRSFRPIEVGDTIRIKRPGILGKDVPTLSPPLTVVEKIGCASFRTSDGKVWNSRRIAVRDKSSSRRNAPGVQLRPFRAARAWTPGTSFSSSETAPLRQVPDSPSPAAVNSSGQSDIVSSSPAPSTSNVTKSKIPTPTFRTSPISADRYPSRVRNPPRTFQNFLRW